jgi:predicted RNA methylase
MTVRASNFELVANNYYATEPWATHALLRRFPMRGYNVWEPAAGSHMMADVLREEGAKVCTSDIENYGREHSFLFDFIIGSMTPATRFDAIVTNPPYGKGNRQAVRFCELALERCSGNVAMLLTAKFDFGKTRHHLFRDNNRFMAKINLVDRISWAGNGETGTEDHAWYVWGPGNMNAVGPRIFYEGKQA